LQRVITNDEDLMNPLSAQLSEARKSQFDAQLDFMRTVTAQAFATAEQVLALNINTSRASVERTADTVRQLFSITDPRDLFTVGSRTQEQLSSLFAYGQELFNIATDARQNLTRCAGASAAPQQAGEPPATEAAPAAPPPAPEAPHAEAAPAPAPAEAGAKHGRKLVVLAETPAEEDQPQAKPIAKAVRKVAGDEAIAPHPSASPAAIAVPGEVHLTQLKPVDSAPPAGAPEPTHPEPRTRKSQRKK
jgi:phasin family protein